jgi:hypothetical protein
MNWLAVLALSLPLAGSPVDAQQPTRRLAVSIGQTVRLQMSGKQRIKTVFNDYPTVVRVVGVPGDPTTVLVTGLAPGRALITLTGEDGKEQAFRIGPP